MYLIPIPKKMMQKEEAYELPYRGEIVIKAAYSSRLYEFAKLCRRYVRAETGFAYEVRRESGNGPIILAVEKELSKEHYRLEIEKTGILITGGDENGVLYGIQTLRQILIQCGGVLPGLLIEDYPTLQNRGYFHDISRGRVPTLDWLKTLADHLCEYKMNQLQLYVEHSFLFSGFSEVWRDDTPLTAEEVMELDAYCDRRGIELIPSLASFGHLYKILSTKSFCHLCELEDSEKQQFSFKDRMHNHTIDVSSEEGFTMIKTMLQEFMPLFRSDKFNICADETFDLGKGKNQLRAEQEGAAEIYTDYLNRLCSFIVEQQHIPMFWGDIMLGFPEMLQRLPKETICLNWGYSMHEKEDATRTYAEAGANQYVCPGTAGWNQLVNLLKPSFLNITKMCRYAIRYGAMGMLNTDWGDYGHINHPLFSLPGLIYGAYAAWNLSDLSYEELNREISFLHFRDASLELLSVVGELSEQDSFAWMTMVQFKECCAVGTNKKQGSDLILEKQDSLQEAGAKNLCIEKCEQQLLRCIKSMDSRTKEAVKPYLLAAEGMKIKNRIGAVLLKYVKGEAAGEAAGELANELETWYLQYRMLWYTLSKESELYRISQVIYWYADFLRELHR